MQKKTEIITHEKTMLYIKPIAVKSSVAAQMLDISRPKMYELASREDFPASFKIDGCRLFSVQALEEWVQKQCEKGGME